MGEKLLKYYKYISDEKGLAGKIELAKLTKVPSTVAATSPDSNDNIQNFMKAIQQITGKSAPTY